MTNDRAERGGDGSGRCRRTLAAKVTIEVLVWLAAIALFAFAGSAVFAAIAIGAGVPGHARATHRGGER
jgi:hypothetical protein